MIVFTDSLFDFVQLKIGLLDVVDLVKDLETFYLAKVPIGTNSLQLSILKDKIFNMQLDISELM